MIMDDRLFFTILVKKQNLLNLQIKIIVQRRQKVVELTQPLGQLL